MEYDKDLRSIQEARDLIKNAKIAQKQFSSWSQADIDKLTKHICEACVRHAEPLAKLAQQERDYESLKMARMLEITDGDLDGAKERVAGLIRSLNKCIAMLSDEK